MTLLASLVLSNECKEGDIDGWTEGRTIELLDNHELDYHSSNRNRINWVVVEQLCQMVRIETLWGFENQMEDEVINEGWLEEFDETTEEEWRGKRFVTSTSQSGI